MSVENTVGSLLQSKSGQVSSVTISPNQSIFDAAQLLKAHRIGLLVVVDGEQIKGVISERDLVTRVIADGLDPKTIPVSQIMSSKVVVALPNESIQACHTKLRTFHGRHLPVVDQGRLLGVISINDIVDALINILSKKAKLIAPIEGRSG